MDRSDTMLNGIRCTREDELKPNHPFRAVQMVARSGLTLITLDCEWSILLNKAKCYSGLNFPSCDQLNILILGVNSGVEFLECIIRAASSKTHIPINCYFAKRLHS